MVLPPPYLTRTPTEAEKQLALDGWMEYKPEYSNGKLVGWKLKHKKQKKDCGC